MRRPTTQSIPVLYPERECDPRPPVFFSAVLGRAGMTYVSNWFHCPVKSVSRADGRSAVAAAAYRLAAKLEDHEYGRLHDYRPRGKDVPTTFTLAPEQAPAWVYEPERLWNAAEAAENRKNSVVAREWELALPAGVTDQEREGIARAFAQELVDRHGVAVSVAIHHPSRHGDTRNWHAHILATTRRMETDGLGKKTRELDDLKTRSEHIVHLRAFACTLINSALERCGSEERVSHLSFEDRGIDREATRHLGPDAQAMERRGEETRLGDINRETTERNQQLDQLVSDYITVNAAIVAEEERRLDERFGEIDDDRSADSRERASDEQYPRLPRSAAEEEALLDADAAPFVAQIKEHGEIRQENRTLNWWEHASMFITHLYDQVRGAFQRFRKNGLEPRDGLAERSNSNEPDR